MSVDSHFWRSTVWPELHNLFYNVVEGKSANWGTSPWYQYFLLDLPRIKLLAFPAFLLGLTYSEIPRRLAFPSVCYVATMSLLKHKEWRFICYVIPSLNIVALAGVAKM